MIDVYLNTPTHNSYVTLDYANDYLTNFGRLSTTAKWLGLTDTQKELALVLAASGLNILSYKGKKKVAIQNLAFPRTLGTQYNNFDELKSNLVILVPDVMLTFDSASKTITSNKDVSLDYLDVVYFDTTDSYYSVKSYNSNVITVYEPIPDGILNGNLYLSDIFGIEDSVRYAQIELAVQLIAEKVLDLNNSNVVEPMVRSIEMGGAFNVQYFRTLLRDNFNLNSVVPLDIVYYHLNRWLTSLGGRVV